MYDYEIEKMYHPENFERVEEEIDDMDTEIDWEDEKRLFDYSREVGEIILEGIKL